MYIKKTLAAIALIIVALFAATATQAQTYSNAVIALNPDAYWPLQEAVQPPPNYIATNYGTLGALGVQGYYESWWTVTNANGSPNNYNTVFTMTNNIVHVAGATGDGDQGMQTGGNGEWIFFPRYTNGVYNPSVTIQVPFSVEAWINLTNPVLIGVNGIVSEGRNNIPGDAGGKGSGTGLLAGRQSVDGGFFLGTVNSPQNTNFTLLYPGGNPGISGIIFDLFNTNGTAFVQPELTVWGIGSNVWYHIVATFDGTNAIMYTNGVLARSVNYYPGQTNTAGVVYAPDTISPLLIGCGPGPDGGRLPGKMDEVAIYPTNLSLAQVSAHYIAASGAGYFTAVTNDNPLIYLRLNEPANPTIPIGQAMTNTVLPVAANVGTIGAGANGVYLPGTAAGAPGPSYSGFAVPTLAAAVNGMNGGVDVGGGFLQGNAQVLNRTNTQPMTIAFWFKGNPSDSRQRFQAIAGHSDAGWRFALDGLNANRFNPGAGPEPQFDSIPVTVARGMYLNDGNWHFVAGVSDGTTASMYLDGTLATNGSPVVSVTSSTNSNNLRDVILGGDPQYMGLVSQGGNTGIRAWDGSISHVAFWSSALTANQIAELYAAAGAPPEIQINPHPLSTFTGYPASFSVFALGGTNLYYQWYDSGGPIGGQTSPTYSIPSASSSETGIYCVVTNAGSSVAVTSTVVSLTVSALPPIASAPYPSGVLALNPLGYWPLNETTPTPIPGNYYYTATNSGVLGAQGNARYKIGYASSGTQPIGGIANLNSTVLHAPGATGDGDQALLAGNGSDWVMMPQITNGVRNPNLSINIPFSIEAWIQMTNPAYQGGYQVIVSEGGIGIPTPPGNGQISRGFAFVVGQQNPGPFGAAGHLQLDLWNTNGNAVLQPTNGVSITSNVWYHVVATFDGTNVFIYTNSVLANNTTYYPAATNAAGKTYIPDTTDPLTIGSGPRTQDQNRFLGKIDEVAIYTNILTGSQVAGHYSAGSGVNYASTVIADKPILYYRLNEKPYQMPTLNQSTYTLATNYGLLGSAARGLYQPGAVPGTPGPVSKGLGSTNAVAFDGEVSVIDVGAGNMPYEFNIARGNIPMTVIAWVKGNPTEGGNPRFQEPIAHSDNSWRIGWDGAPHFTAGAGSEVTATRPINDAQWHMVAGVYALTTTTLYVDGISNTAATFAAGNSAGTLCDVLIGGTSDNQLRMFYGSMAQVAFFTNALTGLQISNLYSLAAVPPFIITQPTPAAQTNNALAGLTNTMVAGGSPALYYQWYHGTPPGGTQVPAGVGRSYYTSNDVGVLIITNLVGADSGNYYVVVTNSSGAVTSQVASSTVFAEPIITAQSDTNLVLFAGYDSFTFAIAAFGGQPLLYYWETNGVVYAITTNKGTLSLTNLVNGLNYSTLLSNSFGMLTSAVWTPSIVAAPTAPYPVVVLNDTPLAYFRLNEADAGNGTIAHDYVSGHNGQYTNVTSFQLSPGYPNLQPTYPVVQAADTDPGIAVGGGLGQQASPTLFSLAGGIPLDFATGSSNILTAFSVEAWVQGQPAQPNNDPGLVTRGTGGGGEQYCLGATGNPNVWRFFIRDATSGGAPGAVAPNPLPANGNIGNNGPDGVWHHLVGVLDEFHSNVVLYVDGDLAASNYVATGIGGVLTQPLPMTIGARQSGTTTFNDQWSGNIDEVAVYNYALSQSQASNHYYTAGIAPYVTLQPLAQQGNNTNANQGETVTITSRIKGTAPMSIQWYDYNFGSPVPFPGMTNATAVFTNVSTGHPAGVNIGSGFVFVEATNLFGDSGQSIIATINVLSGPPTVLAPGVPQLIMVYYGGNATLRLQGGVTGTEPFYYQWSAFGTNLQNSARVTGVNSNALNIAFVQASDSGPYSVLITNAQGQASLGAGASTNGVLFVQTVPNFNTNGLGWTLNNVTVTASISNNVFTGTEQLGSSVSSTWYNTPLYIGAFQASFTYLDATTNAAGAIVGGGADGTVFAIQNTAAGTAAIGGGGGSLGFVGITNSVGFEINIYNGNNRGIGYGINGATFGNGAPNYTVIPVLVASGDPINMTINYDGQVAKWTLNDTVALTTFTTNMNIGSIANLVGHTNTATVGFTMADGGVTSIQTVSNFTFIPIPTLSANLSGGNAVLTWPVLGGYVLQQRTNLTAGSWLDIPAPYPIVNGQQQVTVPVSGGDNFYRLKLEVIQ